MKAKRTADPNRLNIRLSPELKKEIEEFGKANHLKNVSRAAEFLLIDALRRRREGKSTAPPAHETPAPGAGGGSTLGLLAAEPRGTYRTSLQPPSASSSEVPFHG